MDADTRTPLLYFAFEIRKQLYKKQEVVTHEDALAEAEKIWKHMTLDEKLPYVRKYLYFKNGGERPNLVPNYSDANNDSDFIESYSNSQSSRPQTPSLVEEKFRDCNWSEDTIHSEVRSPSTSFKCSLPANLVKNDKFNYMNEWIQKRQLEYKAQMDKLQQKSPLDLQIKLEPDLIDNESEPTNQPKNVFIARDLIDFGCNNAQDISDSERTDDWISVISLSSSSSDESDKKTNNEPHKPQKLEENNNLSASTSYISGLQPNSIKIETKPFQRPVRNNMETLINKTMLAERRINHIKKWRKKLSITVDKQFNLQHCKEPTQEDASASEPIIIKKALRRPYNINNNETSMSPPLSKIAHLDEIEPESVNIISNDANNESQDVNAPVLAQNVIAADHEGPNQQLVSENETKPHYTIKVRDMN